MKRTIVSVVVACFAATQTIFAVASGSRTVELPYRLVFVQRNLSRDEHVAEIRDIVRRSSRLGFNGIVLSGSFDRIDLQGEDYLDRLREVKTTCDENGVELIPLVFSVGYAGGVLAHDRHLAAAVPVKDLPFDVQNGQGVLAKNPAVGIANGGFERFDGQRAVGFDLQDGPGRLSFADAVEHKEGKSSLRFENVGGTRGGKGRVVQKVAVHPFRCYELTLWVKTENLNPPSQFQVVVKTADDRVLMTWRPSLDATGDWRQVTVGFNSLAYENAGIYAGVWNGPSGRFWIDDMQLREVGILNVVRRPGTPVEVKNAETGLVYREGDDFERIEDENLSFEFDQEETPLAVRSGGRIRDGDRLLVSYYQALALKGESGQIGVCMSEPRVYEIWEQIARALHETIAPKHYFFSMDEIREGGWCQTCERRGLSAGEILGDCITRQAEIVRAVSPDAGIFVWSDMLDPNQNAGDNYYLFKGDFAGSWNHIPKDLIIACWNYDTRDKSLRHFDHLGFRTIGCGYYDMDSKNAAEDWLASLAKTPGACGIMYTTWKNRYGFLETFAGVVPRGRGTASNPR